LTEFFPSFSFSFFPLSLVSHIFPFQHHYTSSFMMRQFLVLLALCLLAVSFVCAQQPAQITVNSAEFTVVFVPTAGAPTWRFWQNDNTSFVYKITFRYMFESENGTSSSLSYVANSYQEVSGGWIWPVPYQSNGSSFVNWTNKGYGYKNFDSMSFNSRIPMGAINGTEYPAGKFDIEVDGYQWTSMSDEAQLVLVFSLEYEKQGAIVTGNYSTHGSKTVNLVGSYFSINDTSMAGNSLNETVDVTLKLQSALNVTSVPGVESTDIYIIYDHFDDRIYHDPEFGFGAGPGSSYIWIIILVVVVIAVIVIILIAVIGFILVRRRRRSYDAF